MRNSEIINLSLGFFFFFTGYALIAIARRRSVSSLRPRKIFEEHVSFWASFGYFNLSISSKRPRKNTSYWLGTSGVFVFASLAVRGARASRHHRRRQRWLYDDDDNAATSVFPRTLFATPSSAAAPARANTVPPGSGSWRARYRRLRHRPVARAAFATRPLTGVSRSCHHCRRSRHYRHGRRTHECRPHGPMRFDILLTTKLLWSRWVVDLYSRHAEIIIKYNNITYLYYYYHLNRPLRDARWLTLF